MSDSNTPLVLLPGMMCDARLFLPQLIALGSTRSVQVANLATQTRIEAMAADVLRHAPERFALCGLSMGGIVAMEVMRQAPERVERLALLDTNPKAELDERKQLRDAQLQRVKDGQFSEVMREEVKPLYLADARDDRGVLGICGDMAMTLGADAFVRQSLALRDRRDQQQTLAGIAVPTLVLCGEHDRLCPPETHQAMQAMIPGATLCLVDAAGHLPTLEQPDATNRHLQHWLET